MYIVFVILFDENYSTWSRAEEMALCVKNKEGLIYGFIPKSPMDLPLYVAWR